MEKEPIRDEKTLEFVIFCIENVAIRLGVGAERIYDALTQGSDILHTYLVPCYEPLHTQGKDYIVDDLLEVMAERGVSV